MRKQCRRKHYALANPITLAIEGATITPDKQLDQLRLLELSAIEAFAKGHATLQDWRSMCDMLNLAETMGRIGIGPEAIPVCEAGEKALIEAKDRFERVGRMGTSGEGLKTLRTLYSLHDLQRTSVDRSTYERAITATRNRIRSAHPDVKVLA